MIFLCYRYSNYTQSQIPVVIGLMYARFEKVPGISFRCVWCKELICLLKCHPSAIIIAIHQTAVPRGHITNPALRAYYDDFMGELPEEGPKDGAFPYNIPEAKVCILNKHRYSWQKVKSCQNVFMA